MNKTMIGPIAALIVLLAKDLLNIDFTQDQVEAFLTVALGIVTAIGFKLNWKKK